MSPLSFAYEPDVRAAACGNRAAYARLVDAHRGLVSSLALAIVRDLAASEDIAQEAFVHAWRGLPRLRNPASFLPWLRQLTRNRAHKFLEERRRQRVSSVEDEAIAAAVDPRPRADATLLDAEERWAVAEALEALPDEARETLTLYYREGRSVAQVAQLLGLREDAVKKRLSRARARLRDEVAVLFGEAIARTRPGPDFTAAVLVGLPTGAGPALGAGSVKLATVLGKPLAAGLGGAVAGLLAGLTGLWAGLRENLRLAVDEKERRALRWLYLALSVLAVQFQAAIAFSILASPAQPRKALVISSFLLLWAGMMAGILVGLPRIIARRRAVELAEDPIGAALRHRRARRNAYLGALIGTVVGTVPIVLYVLFR